MVKDLEAFSSRPRAKGTDATTKTTNTTNSKHQKIVHTAKNKEFETSKYA